MANARLGWIRAYWRELLLAAVVLSPWLSLLVLGFVWLHAAGMMLWWAGGTAVLGLVAWPLRRSVRRRMDAAASIARPGQDWTGRDKLAWEKVEAIAAEQPMLSLFATPAATERMQRTMRAVAEVYHPDTDPPEAHVTLPEALLLAETVARNVRRGVLASVPGARLARLDHLLWVKRQYDTKGAYLGVAARLLPHAIDVGRIFMNGPVGAVQLIRDKVLDVGKGALTDRLQGYAGRKLILETGRAAIDLYSGRMRLSKAEMPRDAPPQADEAPVRLLFLGQVNAGKSSLVNALAEDVLCDVTPIPSSSGAVERMIAVDGQPAVVIVDHPGMTATADAQAAMLAAVARCDMVVWVASATQPGRAIDAALLSALRQRHEEDLDRLPPPMLVALTHVDQLSPAAEWAPPYNVVEPERAKEQAMCRAMNVVGKTLDVPLGHIVPIAIPPGADPWNVEFMWGYIGAALPQAKGRKIERLRARGTSASLAEIINQVRGLMTEMAKGVWRG
jgi:predicted GTPase